VVLCLLLSLFFVGCDQEANWHGAAAGVPTVDATQPQRGTHTFVKTQDGGSERPVAWDPCEPIEYYVNDALEPRGAAGLIAEGIVEISSVSGLEFQHLGSTDTQPWTEQQELRPKHEPVVIGWATPRSFSALSGRTVGVAWSRWDRNEAAQELHYVTGQMVLDAPQLRRLLRQPDGRAQARAIVLHELGHLVGLLHVDDPGELMHSENVGRLDWGPGDREGLAVLGAGTCYGG
jgi:hypothetical protein